VERVVFVEGAVTTTLGTPPADSTGAAVGAGAAGGLATTPGAPRVAAAGAPRAATGEAPVYNKIAVPVGDRATAHSVLKRVESSISPFADLEDARIYRPSTEEMMPLDATRILYDYDPEEDIPLEALDRIILPIRQPSVIVGGSVPSPGRYPYNPSETYHYYLNLAGRGVDTYGGLGTSIQIYGVDGTPKGTESFIEPGDTINVVAEDMFVLVAGAVNLPGRIPLVPGQDAYYYIRQAGGFNRELNEGKQFFLYDAQGQMRERGATPQPGDTIQASRNSFVYKFNRYFPVISSGLTFATALVTFLTILNAP
jgi:hypothetical protein